ncbi:unnamed protein product [Effrenium voratum]|uniref:Uncharacterized protein n=1 Tax=Effrenium voratum TaxID=2562239 RepID=A0AA36I543_9DINO|nr:unnamed protein product [Effrenium voratum]
MGPGSTSPRLHGWIDRQVRQRPGLLEGRFKCTQESPLAMAPARPKQALQREVVVISLESPRRISPRSSSTFSVPPTPQAQTAPCTPSQPFRAVAGGAQQPPRWDAVPRAARSHFKRAPVVLPAWPTLAAWTTYQPGTPTAHVERRVSTATTASRCPSVTSSRVERQVSSSTVSDGGVRSRSYVLSPRFTTQPLPATSSFHISPRVYVPLAPSKSFPNVSPRGPPVVHIDLTRTQARMGKGSPAAADVKASSWFQPGKELRRPLSPKKAERLKPLKVEPDVDTDGSQEGEEEDHVKDLSPRSWAMARHREDGRLPSAERQLFGSRTRTPGTVVL